MLCPGSALKKSKYSESQVVAILKQADAGFPVKDIYRQAVISSATYYQWKMKYGGLEVSELKRIKEPEAKSEKLKRMFAELASDNAAMPILRLSWPSGYPCRMNFRFRCEAW